LARLLRCPRCTRALVENRAARIAAHACPTCGGVWLATGLADRLREALEEGRELGLCDLAHATGESAAWRATTSVSTEARGIPCAVCRSPMGRELLPRAGIAIDTCPLHGTWYDQGELQHLVDCIKDPRLRDRAPAESSGSPPPEPARATGQRGVSAALVGGAALGAAGLAAGSLAADPAASQRQTAGDGLSLGAVADGAVDLASDLVDTADVVEGAGAVAEGAADVGFSLLEVIAGLFDW